jgi:hypothetical protein
MSDAVKLSHYLYNLQKLPVFLLHNTSLVCINIILEYIRVCLE